MFFVCLFECTLRCVCVGEQSNWERGRKKRRENPSPGCGCEKCNAGGCVHSVSQRDLSSQRYTAIACLPVGVAAQRCRSFCGWASVLSRKRAVIFHYVTGQDSRLTYDACSGDFGNEDEVDEITAEGCLMIVRVFLCLDNISSFRTYFYLITQLKQSYLKTTVLCLPIHPRIEHQTTLLFLYTLRTRRCTLLETLGYTPNNWTPCTQCSNSQVLPRVFAQCNVQHP